jgi:protein-tyrosine kinase
MNSPILSAVPADHAAESSMGALLLDSGKLNPEDAERVLRMQKEPGSASAKRPCAWAW